jgi:hypothetical protein
MRHHFTLDGRFLIVVRMGIWNDSKPTLPPLKIVFESSALQAHYCFLFHYRENGEVVVKAGKYNPTGPRCMIQLMDGVRTGRCLDGESLDLDIGGPVHVHPCTKRWHQFLSFGNGNEVPKGVLHTNVPLHTRKRIAETGREQGPYMCLGVAGRGDLDEKDWLGVGEEHHDEATYEEVQSLVDDTDLDHDSLAVDGDEDELSEENEEGWLPLLEWENEQLIATSCSNAGAIIEWILVPFIVEDDPDSVEGDVEENTDDEEL